MSVIAESERRNAFFHPIERVRAELQERKSKRLLKSIEERARDFGFGEETNGDVFTQKITCFLVGDTKEFRIKLRTDLSQENDCVKNEMTIDAEGFPERVRATKIKRFGNKPSISWQFYRQEGALIHQNEPITDAVVFLEEASRAKPNISKNATERDMLCYKARERGVNIIADWSRRLTHPRLGLFSIFS